MDRYQPPPPPYPGQGPAVHPQQQRLDPAARFQQLCDRYEIGPDYAAKLRLLSEFEIVVIADDSGSMSTIQKTEHPFGPMETRWDELKRSLFQILDIALLFDRNGLDVYFLNRNLVLRNVTDRRTIENAFVQPPSGCTPLARTVRAVLAEKQAAIQEKKLLLLICTDGEPTNDAGRVDIEGFRRVLAQRQPIDRIYVNIMACSDDPATMAYLAKLDAQIKNVDVVDDYLSEKKEIQSKGPGVRYTYGDHIVKTLVGSIDPELDGLDEESSRCLLQ